MVHSVVTSCAVLHADVIAVVTRTAIQTHSARLCRDLAVVDTGYVTFENTAISACVVLNIVLFVCRETHKTRLRLRSESINSTIQPDWIDCAASAQGHWVIVEVNVNVTVYKTIPSTYNVVP